jgi:hypothetical protein
VIGYYIHHQGVGHLHRAQAIAAALSTEVTGLSSFERPAEWTGPWLRLPRDDEGIDPIDPTADGRLHWVPLHDSGLRERMSQLSDWIRREAPRLIVTDVSVEVSLLARLHGVPVVSFVLPGDRGDAAHSLAHDVSSMILAAWPEGMDGLARGLSAEVAAKVRAVGAISRLPVAGAGSGFPPADAAEHSGAPSRVVVLAGRGGSSVTARMLESAALQTPGWEWIGLGTPGGRWVDDPWPVISSADVVVTHAGQGAIADVAAARRPAIVIPETRPHAEQAATAEAIRRSERWPAIVVDRFPSEGWAELLAAAARLDGDGWRDWNDGAGAERAAAHIMRAMAGIA